MPIKYCLVQFVEQPWRVHIVCAQIVETEPHGLPFALVPFRPRNDVDWEKEKIYFIFDHEEWELGMGVINGWKPVFIRDVADSEEELELGLEKFRAQNEAPLE